MGTLLLTSAGIESCAMLQKACQQQDQVYALYTAIGHSWERVERDYWLRLVSAFELAGTREVEAGGVYAKEHWSVEGRAIPSLHSPDEAVYLPARNILLVSLALPYALEVGASEIWLGTLSGNPFLDATPHFFKLANQLIAELSCNQLRLVAPFSSLKKRDVLKQFEMAPWALTFSCLNPQGQKHCGSCNKCGERMRAFAEAELSDPAKYGEKVLS